MRKPAVWVRCVLASTGALLLVHCGGAPSGAMGGDGAPPSPAGDGGAEDDASPSTGDSASGEDAAPPGVDAAAGGVVFAIDLGKGPARQFQPPSAPAPVSPYVYGINEFAAWQSTTKWGVLRWGGDSFTPWNWTNGFSNSGSDFCFWQGAGSGSGLAAGVGGTSFPSLQTDQGLGVPSLVTVPILDYVASSAVTNNVWSGSTPPCPGTGSCSSGTPNGYAMNVAALDFASSDPTSAAFVANLPTKGSTLCTCAGSSCSGCSVDTSGPVYADEFVNYLKVTYGAGAAPLFFSLDNEPNYWPGTHPELWPHTGTPGCGTSGTVTSDDIVTRNTTFAAAIKSAWPGAKVFAPVVAQDGVIYGGDYSDPKLANTTFTDYYLGQMAAASAGAGHPLLDVYDVHYYTSGGSTSQCVEVPRMFWDPAFQDFSTSQTDAIDFGWSGQNNDFDTKFYPRQMIPRLLGKIDQAYSGKGTAAPGLSFSEYNAGCETSIEGGVAEADLLGIFGREGVYSATAWPLKSITDSGGALTNYLVAAYDLYRNYDGAGAVVGDTSVRATTSSDRDSSVYAFTHSTEAGRVDVVAINKTSAALPVTIQIASAPALAKVSAYTLQSAKAGVTAAPSTPTVSCSGGACSLRYTMPALSATTLVLR